MTTQQRVTRAVCSVLDCSETECSADMPLVDLGADSLDLIEIVVAVENEFGMEFDLDSVDYPMPSTVNDIVNWVEQHG